MLTLVVSKFFHVEYWKLLEMYGGIISDPPRRGRVSEFLLLQGDLGYTVLIAAVSPSTTLRLF